MSEAPAKRAGICVPSLTEGARADFVAADLSQTFVFDKEKCLSKSRNTPFSGTEMTGRAVYSIVKGDVFKCQPIF
jgi:dihydroorotase